MFEGNIYVIRIEFNSSALLFPAEYQISSRALRLLRNYAKYWLTKKTEIKENHVNYEIKKDIAPPEVNGEGVAPSKYMKNSYKNIKLQISNNKLNKNFASKVFTLCSITACQTGGKDYVDCIRKSDWLGQDSPVRQNDELIIQPAPN